MSPAKNGSCVNTTTRSRAALQSNRSSESSTTAPATLRLCDPLLNKDRGIALGCGICPQYSDIDPYWMALAAIDEAVRNVVAVGGKPDKIAILDNFCWGNCEKT